MSNNIRLIVGGFECTQWDDVSIDSDLEIPADAWSLTLFNPPTDPLPSSIKVGMLVEIFYENQQVLRGTIDRITDRVTRQGYALSLSGRDIVGILLDNSVPVKVEQQVTLEDFFLKRIFEGVFGLAGFAAEGLSDSQRLELVAVEPGESIWDVLSKAAEAHGQYLWADQLGTLRFGNPFARNSPPISLYLLRNGKNNNVLSVDYAEDITDQFSEVVVLGQDNRKQTSFYATNNIPVDLYFFGQDLNLNPKNQPDEPEYEGNSTQTLPYPRRKIVLDSLADNNDQAAKRARKLMLDGNLSAYTLTVEVAGWTCSTGQVWETGWTVKYQSDVTRSAANGEWVIMARTLTLGRNGKQTQLKLKRKQYWMQPVAPLPPLDEPLEYPQEFSDDMAQ